MDEFKEFLNYAVIGFDKMKNDNKSDTNKYTAKKLVDCIWQMTAMYEKEQAKIKATQIINSLELV